MISRTFFFTSSHVPNKQDILISIIQKKILRPLWKYPYSHLIHKVIHTPVYVSVLFNVEHLSIGVGFIYYYFESNLERRNPLMNKTFYKTQLQEYMASLVCSEESI